MSELLTEINYDLLIGKHLKGVVIDALKIAADQGLPGENHFYITFRTDYPGVKMPAMLKTQYPESMTIVLQHRFSDLEVEDNHFDVVLIFGGVPHPLSVPFDAITYFADPYAKFGLSFGVEKEDRAMKIEDINVDTDKKKSDTPAEVVSIDRFRKK